MKKTIWILIFIMTYIFFYFLSENWIGFYRIMLPILPAILIISGINFFFYLKKYRFEYNFIYKLLIFILTLLILFYIFNYYSLPAYYYLIFLFTGIIFLLSKFHKFYLISIIIFLYIFFVFQLYLFQQEFVLSKIERSISLKNQIIEKININIENDFITFSYKHSQNLKKRFKIPKELEIISVKDSEVEYDLPLFFVLKEKNKEFPVISGIIIPNDYPLALFDLRIQSILSKMKLQYRILNYLRVEKNYLNSRWDNSIQSSFYEFYDNFYATHLIIGYYAIPFNEYQIIILIREKKNEFLPHSSVVLSFLNSVEF